MIQVRTVNEHSKENPETFDLVMWVLFDDKMKAAYQAVLEMCLQQVSERFEFTVFS
ncbi:MAG: hypothetical protein PUC12_14995 [Clostridiales bacterium]|nr:hypothetical protein [Clostridiales bacterium]